jgi:hypothetical protein
MRGQEAMKEIQHCMRLILNLIHFSGKTPHSGRCTDDEFMSTVALAKYIL